MLTPAELDRFERDARAACDSYRRAKRRKEARRARRILGAAAAIGLATSLALSCAERANERNAAVRAAATYPIHRPASSLISFHGGRPPFPPEEGQWQI